MGTGGAVDGADVSKPFYYIFYVRVRYVKICNSDCIRSY